MIDANVPIWVCSTPVDMRKGFDSLAEHVRTFLGRDPLTDGMFVFRGRSGHLLKILWRARPGMVPDYHRLHKASFPPPAVCWASIRLTVVAAPVSVSSSLCSAKTWPSGSRVSRII